MDENIQKKLQAPFPASEIEFRVQQCGITNNNPWVMVLAYVQARAIQRRLDDIFGWAGWTEEYRSIENNMICRLGVRTVEGEWIYKENGASETQVEAFKGGISGAFKRVAASGFGIGRYLYNLEESFAKCTLDKQNGWNKAKTKDNKYIYWETPKLPAWALPDGDTSQSSGSKYVEEELEKQADKPKFTRTTETGEIPERTDTELISEKQARRMYAISGADAELCKRVIEKYGYKKSDEVRKSDYENICTEIEQEKEEKPF